MTCIRPAAGGGRSRTGTPILPPIATSRPASLSTWAISAVVVDLPLVPVMATNGASGARAARSRAKSSMSPTTGTPASSARLTVQCGSGWVSGTPGASTNSLKLRQSACARSTSAKPAAAARSRAAALSSQAATSAPPATSARSVDRPEPPRPKRATRSSAQGLDRRHRHLSFSEARPTIASTKAMIQNRMTICDSDQPSCSK